MSAFAQSQICLIPRSSSIFDRLLIIILN
jgi:hypothetical protein